MSDENRSVVLLKLARQAIAAKLHKQPEPNLAKLTLEFPFLDEPGACFVTLTKDGHLRGCIGSLQPHTSLGQDIFHNAQAAAFQDPRFDALTVYELEDISIEVSVLTAPTRLEVKNEAEALTSVRPQIDGVVLRCKGHRSTFLPQVWEQLPHPKDFFRELKHKAGLFGDGWPEDMEVLTYQVEKFHENEQGQTP